MFFKPHFKFITRVIGDQDIEFAERERDYLRPPSTSDGDQILIQSLSSLRGMDP